MIFTLIVFALSCLFMILCVLFKPHINIGKIGFDTYWIPVLVGAAVLLITGQTDIHSVFAALTADTAVNPLKILVLFISMTILSIFLDELGFFSCLANSSLRHAGTSQHRLFFYMYITVSVLTVFTSNDIIILTFTPFICYFAKHANISPVPYIIAEFVAANTWSMALVIGNPTNIYLSSTYGISFIEYAEVMLPPTLASGAAAFIILWLIFRKKLSKPIVPLYEHPIIKSKTNLVIGLVHLGVCTLVLAAGSYLGIEMWAVSFVSVISLFIAALISSLVRRKKPAELWLCLKRAPWQLVPFVLSMFVLILSLSENNITTIISGFLGIEHTVLKYGIASFLSANLINNIPMSVLFCSVIEPLNQSLKSGAVYAAVIGSNLGALLTPVGALAGIMWSSILKKHNVHFSYTEFIKYGVIISVPTLFSALGMLLLCLNFYK